MCAQHFSAYQYKMSIMSQSSLKVATLRSLIDGGGGCGTVGGWKKYQKLIIGGGGGGTVGGWKKYQKLIIGVGGWGVE